MKLSQNKSVFRNLLRTGLAPTLVSCLILCLVFVFSVRTGSEAVDNSHMNNLSYVTENAVSSISRNAANLCTGIADAEWFHRIFIDYCLSEKTLTTPEKNEITTDLAVLGARTPYVEQVSFKYFWNTDTLFTGASVYENISFYQEQYPGKTEYVFFENAPDGFSQVTVGNSSYILYSADIADGNKHSNKARVNILFSENKIIDSLNLLTDCEGKAYAIKNSDGTICWSAESGLFPNQPGIEIESKNTVLTVPLSVARKTVRKAVPVILILLMADILLCVLFTVYYSRAVYAPIAETVERFTKGSPNPGQNELELLNSIMTEAFRDKEEAQASLDVVYPLARQRLLRAILDGTAFLDDSYESILSRCGIGFARPLYNVVAVRTSLPDLFSEDSDRSMEFQLTTVAMEDAVASASDGLDLSCLLYLHSANRYSAIVNYGNPAELSVFVQRLYNTLCTSASTLLCEGNEVTSPEDLHIASDQADFAMNMSMPSVVDGILLYQDVIREAKILFYYSHSEEVIFAKAIIEGKLEAAEKNLEVILENNSGLTSFYSVSCLYQALTSTILLSAQEAGVSVPTRGKIAAPKTLSDVREVIGGLLNEVIGKVRQKYSVNITDEEKDMIRYIDEHIYDSDLSLSGVAETFDRSQASVSESFKRITGRKYIDYVNEKRIRKAVELIYSEKLDMQQVYQRVGYISMSTFRRNYQRFAEGRNKKS